MNQENEYKVILPIANEYKALWMETQDILSDIREYRKQFQGRLKQLKEEREKLEKMILEWMETHKHSGFQIENWTIRKKSKKVNKSIKKRTEEVENILMKNKIQEGLLKEVEGILKDSQANHTDTLSIKMN